jgi:hypothetical protein
MLPFELTAIFAAEFFNSTLLHQKEKRPADFSGAFAYLNSDYFAPWSTHARINDTCSVVNGCCCCCGGGGVGAFVAPFIGARGLRGGGGIETLPSIFATAKTNGLFALSPGTTTGITA